MSRIGISFTAAFLAASEHSCSFTIGTGGSAGGHHTHYLGAFILAGFGLLLFYGGFQNYRKLRLLADTPMMPIRSLAMGRVHIRGRATGSEHVTSPLTRIPCFYYSVLVERWEKRAKGGGQWTMCLRHVDHVPFSIQDATGQVLINPHQAELDLPQTFRAETGAEPSGARSIDVSLPPGGGPSESELITYLSQTHATIQADMAAQHESKFGRLIDLQRSVSQLPAVLSPEDLGRRLRFTEECLLPDRECNILGTCAENPNARDSSDRNMILRGENERTFMISGKTEMVIEKEGRQSSLLMIFIGGGLMVGGGMLFLSSFGLW